MVKFKFKPPDKSEQHTVIYIEKEEEIEEKYFNSDFHPIMKIQSTNAEFEVTKAIIDISELKRVLHQWRLFTRSRRMVEIEVLNTFTREHDTLAVKEIKAQVKSGDAGIHRALNNLVKKNLLTKPGKGTYRRNF
ncbi:MAG: type IV toxin-antitoxin system AbiEi family antitoxin domain-containing protein [Candidatus Aenigmarchaeota archaeon]|nr:type IV toxin-antitoxin system AbiEi family antitoxin domain-containing protein [Candidatus Aenigmarchaeota archaeon]